MKKFYFFTILAFFLATGLTYAQQFQLSQEFPGLRENPRDRNEYAKIVGNQAICADLSLQVAYIFEKDEQGKWVLAAELTGSDVNEGDAFGISASITQDKAIVGSLEKAYIFQKTSSGWQEVAIVSADSSGRTVAISGDYTMVANARPKNDGNDRGSVDVFRLTSEGKWVKHQRLVNSDNTEGDKFGDELVMDGDRAVIGIDVVDVAFDSKRFKNLYVFDLNNEGDWVETAIIPGNSSCQDCASNHIDLYHDFVVNGDIGFYSDQVGSYGKGIARIYHKTDIDWTFEQFVKSSDASDNDLFGFGVAIDNNILTVQTESKGTYVYARTSSGNWEETQILRDYNILDVAGDDAIAFGPNKTTIYFLSKAILSDLAVTGFLLIDATTNQALRSVADGDVIDLSNYPNKNFNIEVKTNTTKIGSIYLQLQALDNNRTQPKLVIERTENKAPYAMFGDKSGDYRNWQPEINDYSMLAVPYPESNRGGMSGKVRAINFSVRRSQPEQITKAADYSMFKGSSTTPEFVLVSAETNKPLQMLQNGDVVNLRKYADKNFNIVAKTASVGSVVLELRLNNMLFIRRTENKFPYAAFGDTDEAFRNWEPELGSYKLQATTYLNRFGDGIIAIREINFRIISEPVAAVAESKTETARLSLYPNPASYQVNAKIEAKQSYQLSVFDKFGQKVYSKQGKGSLEESINLSGQQPGLYMVVLEADGQRQSQRLVLQ